MRAGFLGRSRTDSIIIPTAVDLDSRFPSWPGDSPGHLLPHMVEGCPLLDCTDNQDGTSISTAPGIRYQPPIIGSKSYVSGGGYQTQQRPRDGNRMDDLR